MDPYQILAGCGNTGFRQELLNKPFGLLVLAFPKVVMANASQPIDEVQRRPVPLSKARQMALSLSTAIGTRFPSGCTARRTFSKSYSKENSGVCTPITRSCFLYFSDQARTYGSVRSQLMHV